MSESAEIGLAPSLMEAGYNLTSFLEQVTNVAPSIIYVFNQKTRANEYANRNIADVMGFSEAEVQAMGSAVLPELCHPEDMPRILEFHQKLQTIDDGEVATITYRIRHKDGGWRWLISYDTVFERDAQGLVLRTIGATADITAQKEAEAKTKDALRAEALATEQLRAFAYSVSHEMRAPTVTLQMLLGELENGHAGPLSDDAKDLVAKGLETVARMQAVTENTLDFTKLVEQGTSLERVNLGHILSNVMQDLAANVTAADATVKWAKLPDLLVDSLQMHALFRNLISNALKYSRPGVPPAVKVTAQVGSAATLIAVQDNGQGIDPKHWNSIFKMFWRGHHHDDVHGIGLGLQICRHVVTAHGGDIWVDSKPGEGSTFWIRLPGANQ